ncbi:hypothetical protein [Gordonia sp. N1V]|uniref:hypothetical protein n=1 Tax=Gordonia sp. N1V TaxID=3034163 RepID=UPI0023E19100|nr:hypothetical protein [Gordonia sp. N1V]MDF3284662.1 hypothetical protein [Gordonia sp. N1V]
MSSVNDHEQAVNERQRAERRMGTRWNDVVFQAISRDVLNQVVMEERLYGQRLRELQNINNKAKTQLDTIKHQNLT